MKKNVTLTLLLLASALGTSAQTGDVEIAKYTLATAYKSNTVGNPISPWMLCADPTAVEYEGRLYVYGTNDQLEYNTTKDKSNNTYGKITQLAVFSTEDMVNWTHHGIIDVKNVCGWCWTSWAPSIASRVEADGKTHFYLYFTNGASGIGVMTATHPLGPWKDPIGKALIDGRTPGRGTQSNIIDPGVVIDDEGTGWLTFGGGDPNNAGGTDLIPGNARIVKLGKDMASLSGEIVEIPAPYHFEANELNIIGGKFIFSYSSSWKGRNGTDWTKYKSDNADKRITASAPTICSIAYMISETPLVKDSWKYMGDVLPNPSNFGYPGGNNHSHIEKFGKYWYMIYHTHWLARKMGFTGGYRNISINRMTVNETTGVLTKASMTDAGAPALPNTLDPYDWVPAETMANCAGITTQNYLIRGNTVVGSIDAGDWVMIRNVHFGEEGADSVQLKTVGGSGQVLMFLDRTSGTPVAVVDVAQGRPLNKVALSKHVTGTHNVFFVFSDAKNNMRFDSWRVIRADIPDAIETIKMDVPQVGKHVFSLQGTRLDKIDGARRGIFIVDGKKVFVK